MPEQFPPSEEFLDDGAIEAILSGRRPTEAGCEGLVAFARDVHAIADQPAPRPNAALAAVLAAGFSTDKGDLLVTAASNVNGPAPQVAGLPKWRKRHRMIPAGAFTGLAAKIVAGVTAGLAGVTAVGAAGALPGPAQGAVATVVNAVSPFDIPTGAASATVAANPSGGGVKVETPVGAVDTSASPSGAAASAVAPATKAPAPPASARAEAQVSVPPPSVPAVPNLAGPGLPGPGLPGPNNLPVSVPACIKDIVDVKTGQPRVPLNQIAPQAIACVRSLMSLSATSLPTGQLPVGMSECVSSILGLLGTVGTNPGAAPNLAGVDFSTCVPVDATRCMTSIRGLFSSLIPGGGLGFGGAAGPAGGGAAARAGFTVPGLSGVDLSACMPFNLETCLSSLLTMAGNLPGVATGGIPGLGSGALPGELNLSACVPFGSIASLPGLSWLSSFLPR